MKSYSLLWILKINFTPQDGKGCQQDERCNPCQLRDVKHMVRVASSTLTDFNSCDGRHFPAIHCNFFHLIPRKCATLNSAIFLASPYKISLFSSYKKKPMQHFLPVKIYTFLPYLRTPDTYFASCHFPKPDRNQKKYHCKVKWQQYDQSYCYLSCPNCLI